MRVRAENFIPPCRNFVPTAQNASPPRFQIKALPKSKNAQVSCAIYDSAEEDVVDKIVTLAHGKGERASRDNWTSVARARHNRDKNNVSEPALDLLEKYLENGKNLTVEQRDRWSGDYPLSVLDDTIKRIASRLDCSTAKEVAEKYPTKTKYRVELEKILLDVGLKLLVFETIRNKNEDFAHVKYGLPAPPPPPAPLVIAVPTAPKATTPATAGRFEHVDGAAAHAGGG